MPTPLQAFLLPSSLRLPAPALSPTLSPTLSPPHACATPPTRPPPPLPRRAVLNIFAAALTSLALPSHAMDLYKTGTTRYIEQGRPPPTGPAPSFAPGPTFSVTTDLLDDTPNTLEAQDLSVGSGTPADRGALAVASWRILLEDGTEIEDSGASEMFRVGVKQVYPGLDAVLLGMKPGGVRLVRGKAPAFFSDITNGERSLVPSDGVVYARVELKKIDPFGTGATQFKAAN